MTASVLAVVAAARTLEEGAFPVVAVAAMLRYFEHGDPGAAQSMGSRR